MNEQRTVTANHGIIINNRSEMSVSGVTEVMNFDEQTVILDTSMGELTIRGDNLKVKNFATETGNLSVEGTLIAVAYTGDNGNKKSLLGRLFG